MQSSISFQGNLMISTEQIDKLSLQEKKIGKNFLIFCKLLINFIDGFFKQLQEIMCQMLREMNLLTSLS